MKKVYIVTPEAFPVGFAATNRIICYAKALLNAGVETEILIYKRTNLKGNKKSFGIIDNIRYRYVGGECRRNNTKVFALLFDLYDRILLLLILFIKLKPNDYVLGYISRPYGSFVLMITHLRKCFYIEELCEYPYADSPKPKWKIKMGTFLLLKFQFPYCDGIIAISKSLANYAEDHVSKKCKIIRIPILVDLDRFKLLKDNVCEELRQITIVHAGSLTEKKDGILGVIEAFAISSKRLNIPMKMFFTGNITSSPHKVEIEKLLQKYQLDKNVIFTGYLQEKELKTLLYKSTFFIINKYPTMQNKYCFATKLGEYLAMGKVVITTKYGEAVNWLHHKEDTYFVEPCDIEELANAIVEIVTNTKLRLTIEENARKRCEESFSYINYSRPLLLFLSDIK